MTFSFMRDCWYSSALQLRIKEALYYLMFDSQWQKKKTNEKRKQ